MHELLKEMKREMAEIKIQNKRLESRVGGRQFNRTQDEEEAGRDGRTCDYCGKRGHLKATCREKKKAEKKKKEAEEATAEEDE